MRAALLFTLVSAAGCAAGPFAAIGNGGGPIAPGHCTDAAIVDRGDGMIAIAAGAPRCDAGTGYVVSEGAAGAVWQIGDSRWAGPVIANRVEVLVPVARIEVGGDAKALVSGGDAKGLASGGDAKGLASGGDAKGLASGGDARGLIPGGDAKGAAIVSGGDARGLIPGGDAKGAALVSGGNARGLVSGGDAKGLIPGGDGRALAPGGDARGLASGRGEAAVVELRKSASREHAEAGQTVTFTLVLTNVGRAPVTRAVIVDRLSRRLRLDCSDAESSPLQDGTTMLVWTVKRPIAPGDSVKVELSALVR